MHHVAASSQNGMEGRYQAAQDFGWHSPVVDAVQRSGEALQPQWKAGQEVPVRQVRAQAMEDHDRGEELPDPDTAEATEDTGMHRDNVAKRTRHDQESFFVNFGYQETLGGKRV